jgi:predicted flap endonuclease-1-like 5' DNA nuclease
MPFFIIQTLLLLAIAYILGCVMGCWLKRIFGFKEKPIFAEPPVVAAAVAAPIVAAAIPAPRPEPVAFVAPTPAPAPKPAPVVVAPKPKPKPQPKPAAVAAPAKKDDLKRVRGIGRQNEARLNSFGVMTFEQIAGWSKKDQEDYGERLAFPGRIEREEWVKQAKVLAKGGNTEFSKRVDKGEVETSTGKGSIGDLGKEPKRMAKARGGKPDNLTLIDGVGNAIEKRLFDLGIFHFDQIAKMTDAEATWLGISIGFPGRVQRENWVAESKILAAGGMTDHAKKVESGKIGTSHVTKAPAKPAPKKK